MKAGLTTSVILHTALIGFGLFSLSAPAAFNVAEVEALPIDIIPIEDLTQVQEGDKKAPMSEKPAPTPTEKPKVVVDAQKVGDNVVDADTPPTPEIKPKPVETAAAPAAAPEPMPKPVMKPDPEPAPTPEPKKAEVPATEVLPTAVPKQEVKPDPAPETAVAETPEAESVTLPETAPSPAARPKPPQAQTAKAPDHRETEKPEKKTAEKPSSEDQEFDLDQVAALLNKETPSGGGAKHSDQTASLGSDKKTGAKLTQGEMDALKGQLRGCWALPGAGGGEDLMGLRVTIRFNVDESGRVDGLPQIESSSGNRSFDESAVRAIMKCDRNGLTLPEGKFDIWSEIVVNFDPTEMM